MANKLYKDRIRFKSNKVKRDKKYKIQTNSLTEKNAVVIIIKIEKKHKISSILVYLILKYTCELNDILVFIKT